MTISLFGYDWQDVRWIQYFSVNDGTAEGLRRNFPEIPNLGRMHEVETEFLDKYEEPEPEFSPRERHDKRSRSSYSEDDERERATQWRALSPEHSSDEEVAGENDVISWPELTWSPGRSGRGRRE